MTRVKTAGSLVFVAAIAIAAFLLPAFAGAEHHEEGDVVGEIKTMIKKNNKLMDLPICSLKRRPIGGERSMLIQLMILEVFIFQNFQYFSK